MTTDIAKKMQIGDSQANNRRKAFTLTETEICSLAALHAAPFTTVDLMQNLRQGLSVETALEGAVEKGYIRREGESPHGLYSVTADAKPMYEFAVVMMLRPQVIEFLAAVGSGYLEQRKEVRRSYGLDAKKLQAFRDLEPCSMEENYRNLQRFQEFNRM